MTEVRHAIKTVRTFAYLTVILIVVTGISFFCCHSIQAKNNEVPGSQQAGPVKIGVCMPMAGSIGRSCQGTVRRYQDGPRYGKRQGGHPS